MNETIGSDAGALIPKPNLARELGVSSRTLSRWLDDLSIDFPKPIILRKRLYFDRGSVDVWKSARLRASIKAAA